MHSRVSRNGANSCENLRINISKKAAEQRAWRPKSCLLDHGNMTFRDVNKWPMVHSHGHKDTGMAIATVGERLHTEREGERHPQPCFCGHKETTGLAEELA